jgi:hypothetical protein
MYLGTPDTRTRTHTQYLCTHMYLFTSYICTYNKLYFLVRFRLFLLYLRTQKYYAIYSEFLHRYNKNYVRIECKILVASLGAHSVRCRLFREEEHLCKVPPWPSSLVQLFLTARIAFQLH